MSSIAPDSANRVNKLVTERGALFDKAGTSFGLSKADQERLGAIERELDDCFQAASTCACRPRCRSVHPRAAGLRASSAAEVEAVKPPAALTDTSRVSWDQASARSNIIHDSRPDDASRVVQWTTGNVGRRSVLAVLENPALELVGCYAWSAGKAGHDVGELCGVGPVGVARHG